MEGKEHWGEPPKGDPGKDRGGGQVPWGGDAMPWMPALLFSTLDFVGLNNRLKHHPVEHGFRWRVLGKAGPSHILHSEEVPGINKWQV